MMVVSPDGLLDLLLFGTMYHYLNLLSARSAFKRTLWLHVLSIVFASLRHYSLYLLPFVIYHARSNFQRVDFPVVSSVGIILVAPVYWHQSLVPFSSLPEWQGGDHCDAEGLNSLPVLMGYQLIRRLGLLVQSGFGAYFGGCATPGALVIPLPSFAQPWPLRIVVVPLALLGCLSLLLHRCTPPAVWLRRLALLLCSGLPVFVAPIWRPCLMVPMMVEVMQLLWSGGGTLSPGLSLGLFPGLFSHRPQTKSLTLGLWLSLWLIVASAAAWHQAALSPSALLQQQVESCPQSMLGRWNLAEWYEQHQQREAALGQYGRLLELERECSGWYGHPSGNSAWKQEIWSKMAGIIQEHSLSGVADELQGQLQQLAHHSWQPHQQGRSINDHATCPFHMDMDVDVDMQASLPEHATELAAYIQQHWFCLFQQRRCGSLPLSWLQHARSLLSGPSHPTDRADRLLALSLWEYCANPLGQPAIVAVRQAVQEDTLNLQAWSWYHTLLLRRNEGAKAQMVYNLWQQKVRDIERATKQQ